jgi:hypothetical protein
MRGGMSILAILIRIITILLTFIIMEICNRVRIVVGKEVVVVVGVEVEVEMEVEMGVRYILGRLICLSLIKIKIVHLNIVIIRVQ